jgi:stearoyl-CoA desaturase (delta-9 desaturase)
MHHAVEDIRIATVRRRTSFASQLAGILAVIVPPIGVLSAMGVLWGVAFEPLDLWVLLGLYVFCGLGITAGWHRYFAHKSFETSAPVKAVLAIAGSMAMQGPLTQWVTDHRKHHALSDREGDPHSPHAGREPGVLSAAVGLVHAHVGWLFVTKGMERGPFYARDLYADRLLRWIDRLYVLWVALTLGIPFAVGCAFGGTSAGLETMVWGGFVRIFAFQHVTFSINSICHAFGRQAYAARDESRNVWYLAPFSFGESWHNNHHAFPASAQHGLDRFQLDPAWWAIRGLARLGLVSDVKRPSDEQRARRRIRPLAPVAAEADARS